MKDYTTSCKKLGRWYIVIITKWDKKKWFFVDKKENIELAIESIAKTF